MPSRRPVAIPPQGTAEELPRMHVLFDLNAAHNVATTYVQIALGNSPLGDGYALLSLIGGSASITPRRPQPASASR